MFTAEEDPGDNFSDEEPDWNPVSPTDSPTKHGDNTHVGVSATSVERDHMLPLSSSISPYKNPENDELAVDYDHLDSEHTMANAIVKDTPSATSPLSAARSPHEGSGDDSPGGT